MIDSEWTNKYNKMHIKICAEGCKKRVDWLVGILTKAKNAYYSGEPIMSDKQFDRFEHYLWCNDPHNKILKKVGT